jgi:hypothetical protein
MKGSAEVEAMAPVALSFYAGICGWTLARAHARSGDPLAIAAYLGEDDQFDRSISDLAKRYADQNELDYQAFAEAVRSGRLEALEGTRAPSGWSCVPTSWSWTCCRRNPMASTSSGAPTPGPPGRGHHRGRPARDRAPRN